MFISSTLRVSLINFEFSYIGSGLYGNLYSGSNGFNDLFDDLNTWIFDLKLEPSISLI